MGILIPSLTLVFAVASAIGATIAARDVILDKVTGKLNKRGKWFVFFQLLVIMLPVALYIIQSSEDDRREKTRKDDYEESVTRISRNFARSNQQTYFMISDILGGYGYRLDTANRKLDSLKHYVDTAKRTTVVQGDLPTIRLSNFIITRETPDSTYIDLKFQSSDAPSCCYNISEGYALSEDEHVFHFYNIINDNGTKSIFDQAPDLAKNVEIGQSTWVIKTLNFRYFYIWLKGWYYTTDKRTKRTIDNLYEIDLTVKGSFVVPRGPVKDYVEKLIMDNKPEMR